MIVQLNITRKVLFEKIDHNLWNVMEMFFIASIKNCVLKIHPNYPDIVYFIKNDRILFKQYKSTSCFEVDFTTIWRAIEDNFNITYAETQNFLEHMLRAHLGAKVLKALFYNYNNAKYGMLVGSKDFKDFK